MGIENILLAITCDDVSLITARFAVFLARRFDARLTAVAVINERALRELLRSKIVVEGEAREFEKDMTQQGEAFLGRVRKMADAKNVDCDTRVLKGIVHEVILRTAGEIGADFLVMGEIEEFGLRREGVLSEAVRMLRDARCPVVIAKNPRLIERWYDES